MTIGGTSSGLDQGRLAGSGAGPYTFTVCRGAPNSDGTLTIQVAASAARTPPATTRPRPRPSHTRSTPLLRRSVRSLVRRAPTPRTARASTARSPSANRSPASVDDHRCDHRWHVVDLVPGASAAAAAGPTRSPSAAARPTLTARSRSRSPPARLRTRAGNNSTASITVTYTIDTDRADADPRRNDGEPDQLDEPDLHPDRQREPRTARRSRRPTAPTSRSAASPRSTSVTGTRDADLHHLGDVIDHHRQHRCRAVSRVPEPSRSATRPATPRRSSPVRRPRSRSDRQGPTVSACQCLPSANPSNSTSFNCSVTFSESVSGFARRQRRHDRRHLVQLDQGRRGGSGAGPYTFTVSRGAPNTDGTLTIQVAAGAAQDAATNNTPPPTRLLHDRHDRSDGRVLVSAEREPVQQHQLQLLGHLQRVGLRLRLDDQRRDDRRHLVQLDAGASSGSGAGPYTFTVSRGAPNTTAGSPSRSQPAQPRNAPATTRPRPTPSPTRSTRPSRR